MTLAVMGALCLLFPQTRAFAVICIGLLLYTYPYWTLGILGCALPAYVYFNHLRK